MRNACGGQTADMTDMLPTLSAAANPARAQTTPLAADQEFNFSASDFDRVRELIYQRAGISLHAGKQAMVYSFAAYLQWLQANTGASGDAEWQEFVNCLTTNLTSFFREDHHFHALVDDLKAVAGRNPGRPLRIWCSAASTGEEPYSIAITAVEALGSAAPVRIVASDIDTKVLATAQRGVYGTDARGLSPERMQRHFLRGKGSNAGFMRVKPDLAKLIEGDMSHRLARFSEAAAVVEVIEGLLART